MLPVTLVPSNFQQLCDHSQARDEWKVSVFISRSEHCLRVQHIYPRCSISQRQELHSARILKSFLPYILDSSVAT